MSATIKEIARLAECHVSTVSRALKNQGRMKEETRRRILDTARKLNYEPNILARSLVCKKTYTIGVVANFAKDREISFFPKICDEVEKRSAARGYTCIICNYDGTRENLGEHLRLLKKYRVDGIISLVFETAESREVFTSLFGSGIPLVKGNNCIRPGISLSNSVLWDMEKAMDMSVAHLKELGHEKIAFINEKVLRGNYAAKENFLLAAMEKQGLGRNNLSIFRVDDVETAREGGNAARIMLESDREFTAVIGLNDFTAIGAVKSFRKAGLRVPEDISVIGSDNFEGLMDMIEIPLTSIDPGKREMGRLCAETLIDIIEAENKQGENRVLYVEPKLVVRQSTGKAKPA